MKLHCVLLTLALLALPISAAAEPGYLFLHDHSSISDRDGAQPADLFVYSEDGSIVHSGQGGGQFPAGHYAELEEGWYFVEVGRYRAPANAVKFYVSAGMVTVVPSGWVSVRTHDIDEQPNVGCTPWNAELNVFATGADGNPVLTASNRGSGVRTWGAIQLLAGEQLVYFNEVPATFEVVENEIRELPTGFQGPVFGNRPQLAIDPDAEGALRLPLCEDGLLQVPVGTYYASGGVPIDVYPYERRDWTEVEVLVDGTPQQDDLRTSRLEYERYEGEGSTPVALTPEERERLSGGGNGSGVRLNGFGR